MKRIVIDARQLRTSTGRYIERLLHYLQEIDRQHEYIVLLKPGDIAGWNPRHANFSKHVCPHKEYGLSEQIGLKKQLDGLQADLVHFGMVQQPIRYRGTVITTIHDLTTMRFSNPAKNPAIFRFKQEVYKYVIKQAAAKSARILVPSHFVAEDVARFTGASTSKILVTYEAADRINETARSVSQLKDKKFLLYIGRPTPHKNLERLIQAFELLRPAQPDLILALAGQRDSNYERIENRAADRSVQNLYFTGFVTDGQLRWLYERCAAYVFPSLSEGFGLPGLEAMVHDAPVVSSNATCLPEIYGTAAHYFDPKSVEGMARSINEVLTQPTLQSTLIADGQRQAARYSWKRMAEQTLGAYRAALNE